MAPGVHGKHNHIETLSWAVKLTADLNVYQHPKLEHLADVIATETYLVNHGQIGQLKGYYLFSYNLHNVTLSRKFLLTPVNAPKHVIPEGWGQRTLEHQVWHGITEMVHGLLDNHPYVEWHTQQVIRCRHKRVIPKRPVTLLNKKVNFKIPNRIRQKRSQSITDPAYPRQWHLVSVF